MSASVHNVEDSIGSESAGELLPVTASGTASEIEVALLTGGGDRPYAFGLSTALISKGTALDVIAGNDLDCPELNGKPGVNFLNLRGDQNTNVGITQKVSRLLAYYAKLLRYAATAKPKIFHILWNNKFEMFDRTLLMLYYKLLGKRIVFTAHNVNIRKRDSGDTALNRLTLRIQYRLTDRIFVHTNQMKLELLEDFGVDANRVTVIPFGINNSVPNTDLTRDEARQRLNLRDNRKTILFFGNITPYKGLEFLVTAFQQNPAWHDEYRLIIAGWPKNCEPYWAPLKESIREDVQSGRILLKAEYIPDEETEIYFKAADVLVLPYRHIYQSGVLFLGYSYGLPVLASDVGSLRDEILEGETGFVFKTEDPADLARAVERYFASDLFANLTIRRPEIRDYAIKGHSWDEVGKMTVETYAQLIRASTASELSKAQASTSSAKMRQKSSG